MFSIQVCWWIFNLILCLLCRLISGNFMFSDHSKSNQSQSRKNYHWHPLKFNYFFHTRYFSGLKLSLTEFLLNALGYLNRFLVTMQWKLLTINWQFTVDFKPWIPITFSGKNISKFTLDCSSRSICILDLQPGNYHMLSSTVQCITDLPEYLTGSDYRP